MNNKMSNTNNKQVNNNITVGIDQATKRCIKEQERNKQVNSRKNSNKQNLIIYVQTCKDKERKMKVHNIPVSKKKQ